MYRFKKCAVNTYKGTHFIGIFLCILGNHRNFVKHRNTGNTGNLCMLNCIPTKSEKLP